MRKAIVVAVALTLALSASAFAGANVGQGKVAVHVLAHASRTCTKDFPAITGCGDIITTEPGADADCFPVFFDLAEYQGLDYGMTWPGMYSCAFITCSPLAIGMIIWPGDGISHAWYACQPGPVAIPGWGWIWDYGIICVIPHPTAGGPNIGDCLGQLDYPICSFCGGIGGYVGDDPCWPTGADESTWGGIKGMFR